MMAALLFGDVLVGVSTETFVDIFVEMTVVVVSTFVLAPMVVVSVAVDEREDDEVVEAEVAVEEEDAVTVTVWSWPTLVDVVDAVVCDDPPSWFSTGQLPSSQGLMEQQPLNERHS